MALGSALPAKLGVARAEAAEAKRQARRQRTKTDRERTGILEQLRPQLKQHSDMNRTWGQDVDLMNQQRGQCARCLACPGYCMPPGHVIPQSLLSYCALCGCEASHHEVLKVGESLDVS